MNLALPSIAWAHVAGHSGLILDQSSHTHYWCVLCAYHTGTLHTIPMYVSQTWDHLAGSQGWFHLGQSVFPKCLSPYSGLSVLTLTELIQLRTLAHLGFFRPTLEEMCSPRSPGANVRSTGSAPLFICPIFPMMHQDKPWLVNPNHLYQSALASIWSPRHNMCPWQPCLLFPVLLVFYIAAILDSPIFMLHFNFSDADLTHLELP